jgi:hypothetical protein
MITPLHLCLAFGQYGQKTQGHRPIPAFCYLKDKCARLTACVASHHRRSSLEFIGDGVILEFLRDWYLSQHSLLPWSKADASDQLQHYSAYSNVEQNDLKSQLIEIGKQWDALVLQLNSAHQLDHNGLMTLSNNLFTICVRNHMLSSKMQRHGMC